MPQKYKFFIKDYPVTFSKSRHSGQSPDVQVMQAGDRKALREAIAILMRESLPSEVFVEVAEDLEMEAEIFTSLPVVTACGGYVLNPNNELLMIHRRGYWDLPKGKTEGGESWEQTALREVEEECRVKALRIATGPFETYHVYLEKGVPTIKRCIWYGMYCPSVQAPYPQREEDITEAIWADEDRVRALLPQAYPSIREVVNHFLKERSSITSGG